jgi:hypothetical protein
MLPPNFPCLDYFGIFKKCRGLGAARGIGLFFGEEDFTREAAKDYIICFFFAELRANFLISPTNSTIHTAM